MKNKIIIMFVLVLSIVTLNICINNINKKRIDKIYDSLVYIECVDDDTTMAGTGFVYKIDKDKNYILTNSHVIEGYTDIYAYNIKKEKLKASIVNDDIYNDIAILEIEDKLGLKEVKFGISHIMKSGNKVFVIGNPGGINNMGSISNGRIIDFIKIDNLFDYELIKISAQSDFGSSGSPVLNEYGEVVGMISLKDKDKNNSYAIPIDFIKDYIKGIN